MRLFFLWLLLFALSAQAHPPGDPKRPNLLLDIKVGTPLLSLDYSPDGSRIVTGGQASQVIVWDARTGQRLMALKGGHTDDVVAVKYSPNGRFIASGGVDNKLIIWDAITGDLIHKMTEHTDYVRDVAFSPDSKLVATAGWDGRSMVWDVLSGSKITSIDVHRDNVTSVAFSPDGSELLTASGDKTMRVWDTKTWKEKYALLGHTDEIWDARYAPNGKVIVSGAWDNTVRVWNVASRQPMFVIPAHVSDVWSVAFSPDGQLIASGGGDSKVRVWDAATGGLVQEVSGEAHTAEVESVIFNPDGKTLASVSRDGSLKIWKAPTVEDRIAAYVNIALSKWTQKGEFEKTADYQKRMDRKDKQTELLDRECRDKIISAYGNTVDWQAFKIGAYDADNETFTLNSPLFSVPYKIKVPPREAERVRANFAGTRYGFPTFEIENNTVMLRKVDVTVPIEDYTKTYSIIR